MPVPGSASTSGAGIMESRLDLLLNSMVKRRLDIMVLWGDSTVREDWHNAFLCTMDRTPISITRRDNPDAFRLADTPTLPTLPVPVEGTRTMCRQRDGACVHLLHVHFDKVHEAVPVRNFTAAVRRGLEPRRLCTFFSMGPPHIPSSQLCHPCPHHPSNTSYS